MSDERQIPKICTLIEVGVRIVNIHYLISVHRVGEAVDVTMEAGERFRLSGPEADFFVDRVRDFLPDAPRPGRGNSAGAAVRGTVVIESEEGADPLPAQG